MSFVHLHLHTHYSLLDGLSKPEDVMKRVKENNQPAVAITDHGVMAGCIDFYKAAKSHDIKPILGCELYVARHGHLNKRPGIDVRPFHQLMLARNQQGYENLLKLTTIAHLEGFYYRPRVDLELLQKYSKGLIATSGCINGMIPQALMAGNEEEAEQILKTFREMLGEENFYIEIQDHPEAPEVTEARRLLTAFAKRNNVPLVATNDCHYTRSEDHEAHDTLICIQTNANVADSNRMRYRGDFSIRSTKDMTQAFLDVPEAIANTLKIAKQCHVNFHFNVNLIPQFNVPEKKTAEEYLRELVYQGLISRYDLKVSKDDLLAGKTHDLNEDEKEKLERIDFELNVIHDMGFDTYFLIVWDFIKYAKDNDVIVGPGRGSAAGALIAYCLHITDIDPLKYDLLFERFLNPERVSMPDIDIDFEDDKRDKILDYVANKYGRDHVAQICTHGTMAARAAVKDVGRAQGVSFSKMNEISKLIPFRPGITIEDALNEEPDLKGVYDTDPEARRVIDTAIKLEGTIRHVGVHACAVVISKDPLTEYTALQYAPGKSEGVITQYSMKPLEMLGLLKMDFLGLRNLTIIRKTLDIIKRRHKKDINISTIPLDDPRTYALLSRGETTGVFQLESAGMKRYLKDLQPSEFEDIIAMVSLYRPGPMDFIPDYISGKHGTKKVKYVHKDLEPILKNTYGIAVYQEQILEIARKFAGFSLGEADLLRRAIGKKIASELKAQRAKFIQGGTKKGYTQKLATDIFDKVIEPFANYGFNKSHAACYAMIAYETAYLKSLYPAEFMAALLTSDQDNSDRIALDIEECGRMGISILPPDINESLRDFTVTGDTVIRFGLAAIKNLGDDTIESIIDARDMDGAFLNIGNLATRLPHKSVNKKSMEALAKSGAFDSLKVDRNAIIRSVDLISDFAKHRDDEQMAGQTDIFGMMKEDMPTDNLVLRKVESASQTQELAWEKEILGLYVSSHPLKGLGNYLKKRVRSIGSVSIKDSKKTVQLAGLITGIRKITTKKGEQMTSFILEDLTGTIQAVVFPRVFAEIRDKDIFTEDNFLVAAGKIDFRNNELQFICQQIKKSNLETVRENAKQEGLFDIDERVKRKSFEVEDESEKVVKAKAVSAADAKKPPEFTDVTDEILAFGEKMELLS